MKRLTIVIILYVLVISFGFIFSISYYNQFSDNDIFSMETVLGFHIEKITSVDKKKIFNVMADVESYPIILPNNVISVKIINNTQPGLSKVVYVKDTLVERGVIITSIIKHDIFAYEQHIISVEDGDAKGTTITIKFKEIDEGTKLDADVKIKIKGLLAPFGQLARSNLESALNTILDSFIEYAEEEG